MPFQREWRQVNGGYELVPNRDRTGYPRPVPETGLVVEEDGVIALANQNVRPDIPPATPVQVNLPGPNEPLVLSNGRINPRWWRFFDELYRRTGGPVDNINRAPTTYVGNSTPDALALAGIAPTVKIDPGPEMKLGTVTLAGQSVKLHGVMEPGTATMTITEQDADRTVA